jgi:hypothetical protein
VDADQRMTALSKANATRLARAEKHQKVAAAPTRQEGRALVADILEAPEDFMLGAPLREVLEWPVRMGGSAVDKLMNVMTLSWDKRVGELTQRQVRELAQRLRETP